MGKIYPINRGVMEVPMAFGLPFPYALKLGIWTIALVFGFLISQAIGLPIYVLLLVIVLFIVIYATNKLKYKKYGNNEKEIKNFKKQAKRIEIDNTKIFESIDNDNQIQ